VRSTSSSPATRRPKVVLPAPGVATAKKSWGLLVRYLVSARRCQVRSVPPVPFAATVAEPSPPVATTFGKLPSPETGPARFPGAVLVPILRAHGRPTEPVWSSRHRTRGGCDAHRRGGSVKLWGMDSADHVPQRPPRRIARGAGVRAIDHGRSASALRAGWSRLLGALVTTWLLIKRVAVKSWTEGIVGRSGQAAFWQTLSLPPLLMGLLGALGYVSGWFGPQTLEVVRRKIITASNQVFSDSVVEQIISPTIDDMLARGRGSIV